MVAANVVSIKFAEPISNQTSLEHLYGLLQVIMRKRKGFFRFSTKQKSEYMELSNNNKTVTHTERNLHANVIIEMESLPVNTFSFRVDHVTETQEQRG
jgi:hypothetical protein